MHTRLARTVLSAATSIKVSSDDFPAARRASRLAFAAAEPPRPPATGLRSALSELPAPRPAPTADTRSRRRRATLSERTSGLDPVERSDWGSLTSRGADATIAGPKLTLLFRRSMWSSSGRLASCVLAAGLGRSGDPAAACMALDPGEPACEPDVDSGTSAFCLPSRLLWWW